MSLTGIRDIDLLIMNNLKDVDIYNFNKCISLKDEIGFWKNKMKKRSNVNYKNIITPESWKTFYFETSKFVDFFHLTLLVNFLKDYFQNNFSVGFLISKRKKIKSEGFFPLLDFILDFLNKFEWTGESLEPFEDYLIKNRNILSNIQKQYKEIDYFLSCCIFHKNYICLTRYGSEQNLKQFFSDFIFRKILQRENPNFDLIISSSGSISHKFEMDFKIDF